METPTSATGSFETETLVEVGTLTRILWRCAGADENLLLKCPNADKVKFQGLGGIVLATGILAFLSGSYAFYTVFSPKVDTALGVGQVTHMPSVVASVLAGLVWSAIIFNLERFIVSSTGKGDGTERITLTEFINAIPRIIMGTIIGVTLSAPLEIRILESEIEAELQKEQREYRDELDSSDTAGHVAKKVELTAKIAEAQSRLDAIDEGLELRRGEINVQRQKLEDEAAGLSGSKRPGRGPAYLDKKANLDAKQAEFEIDRAKAVERATSLKSEIDEWKNAIASSEAVLAERQFANEQQSHALDGLLKRIQISHKIGGNVPLMIAALLMCIELGPIFFKMMLTKGVYESLEEHQKRLLLANAGIESGEGSPSHSYAYEAIIEERRRMADTERELSSLAHAEYRRVVGDEVRAAPLRFVSGGTSLPPAMGWPLHGEGSVRRGTGASTRYDGTTRSTTGVSTEGTTFAGSGSSRESTSSSMHSPPRAGEVASPGDVAAARDSLSVEHVASGSSETNGCFDGLRSAAAASVDAEDRLDACGESGTTHASSDSLEADSLGVGIGVSETIVSASVGTGSSGDVVEDLARDVPIGPAGEVLGAEPGSEPGSVPHAEYSAPPPLRADPSALLAVGVSGNSADLAADGESVEHTEATGRSMS